MESLRQPEPLRLTGNVAENWRMFLQCFELWWSASSSQARTDAQKMAAFLHVAGPEAIKVYNTFEFANAMVREYATVVQKFQEYCTPRVNETYERYVFRNYVQAEGESIEKFLLKLKEKVSSCNYGNLTDSLIRDQIVCGVLDIKMRERLLREDNLTLERAVQLCQASEATEKQLRAWNSNNGNGLPVEAVTVEKRIPAQKVAAYRHKSDTKTLGKNLKNCMYCGEIHNKGQCPAYGKFCNKCKKKNHYAKVCKSKIEVHFVEKSKGQTNNDLFIEGVELCSEPSQTNGKEWVTPVIIEDTIIDFKVDTGAQVDLMPMNEYRKLKAKPTMEKCHANLYAYGGTKIKTYGCIQISIKANNQQCKTCMIIVESGYRPLLGLDSSERLGLIKRVHDVTVDNKDESYKESMKKKYSKLFTGVGCLKGKHRIILKDDNEPVVQAPRRVPFSIKPKLKEELDRMTKEGIIKKIDGPTDWVNSLVIVEKKDGSLRLCLDPKDLNANIKREHYQIPTRDELEAEIGGAKYFSKLDAQSGFYQIPLDKESSFLCTFNTPIGRYRFLRLPFGISSAPEIFHKRIVMIFDGVEGIVIYLDDILVWGRTLAEHNERLDKVLRIASEAGITLNFKKCQFCVTEIDFLGDRISACGISPNPSKVQAVMEMPTPQTKADVLRALGTVNYMGKFVPSLSMKTGAMRSLLKKDTEMCWEPEHEREWTEIKKALTSAPVLKLFDPHHDTKVSVDASGIGLGAVLQQKEKGEWRPVAYASRSLLDAETRYAPIEKEALALVFGCQRFHSYIYGKDLILETDHKPLTAIALKNLSNVTPRLQRIFMCLLRYQFDLQYVPGKLMIMPDALSRAVSAKQVRDENDAMEEVQIHVDLVISTLPVGETMLKKIAEESMRDEELRGIITMLTSRKERLILPKPYNTFEHELSVVNGILMKGTRIIIPKALEKEILSRIHEGHLGIGKCRSRARQCVYWPGLNRDLEVMIKNCETCLKFHYKQPREPLMLREVPTNPWERIGADIAHYAGENYLIVYDSYSNYPEMEKLQDLSTRSVIEALMKMIGRHGIPCVLNSDNGPQFASLEFANFANHVGFKIETSSPYFPESNGLAEKGVQVVKRILKKCGGSNTEVHLGLLNYRSSPLVDGRSPCELLMGRRLRTRVPMVTTNLGNEVKKKKQQRQGQVLKNLKQGESVRILEGGKWMTRAQVQGKVAPRSYAVQTESGGVIRRNRQHLLSTKEQYIPDIDLRLLQGGVEQQVVEQNIQEEPIQQEVDVQQQTDMQVRRSGRIRKQPARLNL